MSILIDSLDGLHWFPNYLDSSHTQDACPRMSFKDSFITVCQANSCRTLACPPGVPAARDLKPVGLIPYYYESEWKSSPT
jgi:hypothetical protein